MPRSTQPELLDGPLPPAVLAANLRDVRAANRFFGGTASVLRALGVALGETAPRGPLRVLDVATGSADVPLALRAWARRRGLALALYASDVQRGVLNVARAHAGGRVRLVCHSALALPFADCAFDIVICAQALHHFEPPEAAPLLRELARAARHAVVVCDLARSRRALWGARALALTQRSPVSRHDGPLSARRAYTVAEARALAGAAGLVGARVEADGPFRLRIVWRRT